MASCSKHQAWHRHVVTALVSQTAAQSGTVNRVTVMQPSNNSQMPCQSCFVGCCLPASDSHTDHTSLQCLLMAFLSYTCRSAYLHTYTTVWTLLLWMCACHAADKCLMHSCSMNTLIQNNQESTLNLCQMSSGRCKSTVLHL